VLGGDVVRRIEDELRPWVQMWCDVNGIASRRVSAQLASVLPPGGTLPLLTFIEQAAAAKMDVRRGAETRMAAQVFAELKAAWIAELTRAPDTRCRTLTSDELGFLRRTFPAEAVTEYAWPSLDLQIAARSAEAVARGEYVLVVAEVHYGGATLANGVTWACPDLPAWGKMARSMAGEAPLVLYGAGRAMATVHTSMNLVRDLEGLVVFACDGKFDDGLPHLSPRDVVVGCDASGDVRMYDRDGRNLGSFAQSWTVGSGPHPFAFLWEPHTPRLYVGGIVVQREAWIISADAYGTGGTRWSRVTRTRDRLGLPRNVYVRPTPAALRRGAGADKDIKPIFVDLDSTFGVEIMDEWLRKFAAIEVTEMMPGPDELLWQEPAGPHTFEIRIGLRSPP